MNRVALLVSAMLTAIVVAVLGGVVYTARGTELAKAKMNDTQDVQQVAATTGMDTQTQEQLQQMIQQRDAEYQNLINEANARLEQAQQKQQELETQLAAMQSPSVVQSPEPVVSQAISPQQAAQIAAISLGQSTIYSVESASFNGVSAYKVTFSSGDVAYVSMDGQVLTVQQAKNAQPVKVVKAKRSGGEGDEHEGGEDDD